MEERGEKEKMVFGLLLFSQYERTEEGGKKPQKEGRDGRTTGEMKDERNKK